MTFEQWFAEDGYRFKSGMGYSFEDITRMAWDAAVVAEREACAEAAEAFEDDMGHGKAQKIADAIRMRPNLFS